MPELANEVVSCPPDYIPASMVRNPIGNNIELIKATVGSLSAASGAAIIFSRPDNLTEIALGALITVGGSLVAQNAGSHADARRNALERIRQKFGK